MEIYSEKTRDSLQTQFSFLVKILLATIQDLYDILYDVKKASEVELNYSKLQCMLNKTLTIFFLS